MNEEDLRDCFAMFAMIGYQAIQTWEVKLGATK
jgi:hypothetical protein